MLVRTPSIQSTDLGDPLAAILRPPAGESDGERQLRMEREAEAKRVSDAIDDELKKDERKWRKKKEDVKVRSLSLLCLPGRVSGAFMHSMLIIFHLDYRKSCAY